VHPYKGKEKKDLDQKEKSFKDIGGCEQAKSAIEEIIDCIKDP
jgi:ATP-dependent Zn protease